MGRSLGVLCKHDRQLSRLIRDTSSPMALWGRRTPTSASAKWSRGVFARAFARPLFTFHVTCIPTLILSLVRGGRETSTERHWVYGFRVRLRETLTNTKQQYPSYYCLVAGFVPSILACCFVPRHCCVAGGTGGGRSEALSANGLGAGLWCTKQQ